MIKKEIDIDNEDYSEEYFNTYLIDENENNSNTPSNDNNISRNVSPLLNNSDPFLFSEPNQEQTQIPQITQTPIRPSPVAILENLYNQLQSQQAQIRQLTADKTQLENTNKILSNQNRGLARFIQKAGMIYPNFIANVTASSQMQSIAPMITPVEQSHSDREEEINIVDSDNDSDYQSEKGNNNKNYGKLFDKSTIKKEYSHPYQTRHKHSNGK